MLDSSRKRYEQRFYYEKQDGYRDFLRVSNSQIDDLLKQLGIDIPFRYRDLANLKSLGYSCPQEERLNLLANYGHIVGVGVIDENNSLIDRNFIISAVVNALCQNAIEIHECLSTVQALQAGNKSAVRQYFTNSLARAEDCVTYLLHINKKLQKMNENPILRTLHLRQAETIKNERILENLPICL